MINRPTDFYKLFIGVLLSGWSFITTASEKPSTSEQVSNGKVPRLYFILPKDGQTVKRNFDVIFGLSGMGVAPAGIDYPNTGHHHLLINIDSLLNMERPIPTTSNILHFGSGQTQTRLNLPPGKHSLQLLLGNYLHIPHKPPVISKKITIFVE
jgi:hypothetical protein